MLCRRALDNSSTIHYSPAMEVLPEQQITMHYTGGSIEVPLTTMVTFPSLSERMQIEPITSPPHIPRPISPQVQKREVGNW